MPVLGFSLDLEAAKQIRLSPGEVPLTAEENDGKTQGTGHTKKFLRAAWITSAIALLILVTVYLAEFFQQPLVDSALVREKSHHLIYLGVRVSGLIATSMPAIPFRLITIV